MKLIKRSVLIALLCLTAQVIQAQVVSDIKPSKDGKLGEFTEWKNVDITFDDNSTATIEYRIALMKRKGIGCHYSLQVKNTSAIKLTVKMKSSYYDQLVKGYFGDEIKATLKPGAITEASFIAQGCKKEKDSDADDYTACTACEFGIAIHVFK